MQTALIAVGVVAFFGLLCWSVAAARSFAADLAARPEKQFHVAGLNKAHEVGRHAVWGSGPLRRRRVRRRLDAAAAKIARHEIERRRSDARRRGPR